MQEYISSRLTNKIFDKTVIKSSTFEDVDMETVDLFFDSLNETSKLKNVIGKRDIENILITIGAGERSDDVFHLTNAGALCFCKKILENFILNMM